MKQQWKRLEHNRIELSFERFHSERYYRQAALSKMPILRNVDEVPAILKRNITTTQVQGIQQCFFYLEISNRNDKVNVCETILAMTVLSKL